MFKPFEGDGALGGGDTRVKIPFRGLETTDHSRGICCDALDAK